MLLSNGKTKFKINYFTKYFINYSYLLNLGLHLGGNYKLKHMTNSSLIYGFKQNQTILNLTKTLFELKKTLKIIETISFKRGVLYYVNNSITFQTACQNIFYTFNKYLLKKKKIIIRIYL